MKLSGGAGSEDRNKLIAVAAFVVVAALLVYFQYFDAGSPSTATPAPSAVSAPASPAEPVTSAILLSRRNVSRMFGIWG